MILIVLMSFSNLVARNPISPPGVYLADPSARVFDDGRVYVYASVDKELDSWCSHTQHVLSTSDMIEWTLHRDIFRSQDPNDKVPYSDKVLFAPDAVSRNGKYYLYYCMPDPKFPEGVAVSDNPVKGFSEGEPMQLHGYNQIDPAVFIDDDGTAYYLWGQFTLKMGHLNADMKSVEESSVVNNVLTEADHQFHEGIYMTKRNGIYYLVYSHLDKAHRPTQIGYSTATNPTGPYTYGGVIIDNAYCDPGTWNNHGSLIEFKDQWYIFYHRSTHGASRMRKACVEPIYFADDGSIPEVEMTSQGAGPSMDASTRIDAASACILHGNVRIEGDGSDNEILTKIHSRDRSLFRYLQFSGKEEKIRVRAKAECEATISVVLDSPWNRPIATLELDGTEDGDWKTYTSEIKATQGKHALWLLFKVNNPEQLSVDWFQF